MTHREYGQWPGWLVEAGWSEDDGGCFYATASCRALEGEATAVFDLAEVMRLKDATPKAIQQWLEELAERVDPVIEPPPGFIRHLWDDRGMIGDHQTVRYAARVLPKGRVATASR